MFHHVSQPLIGVITASASQSEQRQILKGITSQAQKLGAAVAVFSNIYNSAEYFAEVEVENRIYELINAHPLDGLILTAECFMNTEVQNFIAEQIAKRSDIPVIVTGAELEGFTCVNTVVSDDIEAITNHLIEVHRASKIDFLTGWEHMETSQLRVQGFRRALASHGISFDPNHIIYGDFWMSSGETLAMEYIQGIRPLPEAIICANDYMAYGLCDTFLENGYSLPEDVLLIGYEYTGERYYHSPILTTYQRNRKAIGAQAVNLLWEKMTGSPQEPVSTQGYFVHGETCGCPIDKHLLCQELTTVRQEQFYSKLNLVGNFEQQLTLCRSLHDYIDTLQQFAYLIRGIQGLHLCLYENWCSSDIADSLSQSTETMVYYRVISKKQSFHQPIFFQKSDLFPNAVPDCESGDLLYFCPVFFSGRELGYLILQYDHPDCYDLIFRDWLKIASNALEFLRMKNDIGTLLACRELSEAHDSITGLYNLNGLTDALTLPLHQADEQDTVQFLLIRTGLFMDHQHPQQRRIAVRMDMETAECLKKFALQKNAFCAKVSEQVYAFVLVGNGSVASMDLLADKMLTSIQYAPLFHEHCGLDSLIIAARLFPAIGFQLHSAIHDLQMELQQTVTKLTKKRSSPNYPPYTKLRNALYHKPEQEWDAQQSCRDLHLSYGHFRATYKDFFGISFHQDLIRSRISFAKHLLLTTAMSISDIALQCGYEDDKYFLRQFRKLTGMTPLHYRSMQ